MSAIGDILAGDKLRREAGFGSFFVPLIGAVLVGIIMTEASDYLHQSGEDFASVVVWRAGYLGAAGLALEAIIKLLFGTALLSEPQRAGRRSR